MPEVGNTADTPSLDKSIHYTDVDEIIKSHILFISLCGMKPEKVLLLELAHHIYIKRATIYFL